MKQSAIKISSSHLSELILGHEFPRKFTTPNFDYYSGTTDSVQHIRYFLNKMVVYSRSEALMCLTFPSSLKGVTSD